MTTPPSPSEATRLAEEAKRLAREHAYLERIVCNGAEAMRSHLIRDKLFAAIDRLAALASTQAAEPNWHDGWKDGYAAGIMRAAPLARVPLTMEKISRIMSANEVYQYHPGAILQFVRDIEAAHGITALTTPGAEVES